MRRLVSCITRYPVHRLRMRIPGRNKGRRAAGKQLLVGSSMDAFDGLPLELVALVLEHLTSEDLISCLQVCSSWRRVVSGFRGLWTRRCRTDYGIPDHCLLEDEDPVAVFLAARRQRNCVRACKHRVYRDIRGSGGVERDDAATTQPHQVVYAGHGVVVSVMFRQKESETQQESQATDRDHRATSALTGAHFTPYKVLKQRYQFGYLLIERLSETGPGSTESCRVELEEKWKWPVVTNAFTASNRSWVILKIKETWIETAWYKIMLPSPDSAVELSGPMWKTPDFSSEHHPSIPYSPSCCSSCSAVALVKNKLSMRPPWEFGVDVLHLSRDGQQLKEHTVPILNYDKMRLSSDVHANVTFRAYFFCKEPSESDTCQSHKLLLWRTNDHIITVHSYSDQEGVSREPEATFSPLPQGKTLELSTAWGQTKLNLSADFRLLGFLIARRFHLWSLETNRKLNTIDLEGIPGIRSWMLALGHMYSLFGTLHDEGEIVLVATKTGEVVWRCQSFLGEGDEMIGGRPFQLSGVVHEDWMSNVHRPCPKDTPFLLYSPLNTPTFISGLALSV